MNRLSLLLLSLIVGSVGAVHAEAPNPAIIHVAPNGDDTASGTAEHPFATLTRARDEIRKHKRSGPLPANGVTVMVHGGRYILTNGLELTGEDSGSAASPVVFQTVPGEEVHLIGDRVVKSSEFEKVTDLAILQRFDSIAREHIVELDLSRIGIAHAEPYSSSFVGGGGLIQLQINGKRLPLSRWPNGGYTTMGEVVDNGDNQAGAKQGGAFHYQDERPGRWLTAMKDDGVWLAGFWRVPWVITSVRLAAIDPESRLITLAVPISGGIGSKYSRLVNGVRKGTGKENFYALNLPEEIDQPGEWCVSFKRHKLYLWPQTRLEGSDIRVSDTEKPLITLHSTSWIVLRGFTLEGGLGNSIEIRGGSDNLVAGCTVHHNGGVAVLLKDGARNGVKSCDLFHLGGGGITMIGGDRATLTAGGLYAVNNHIHHIGEVMKIGAAIDCEGVGNIGAMSM